MAISGVGFVESAPASNTSSGVKSDSIGYGDHVYAGKFVAPSSGTLEISEIGCYGYRGSGSNISMQHSIQTHSDSYNDPYGCPSGTMVSNSQSSSIRVSNTSIGKLAHTYGTRPQVTGGITYWLCQFWDNSTFAGAGTGYNNSEAGQWLYDNGRTFPTWPSAAQWGSPVWTYSASQLCSYAVYSAVESEKIVPLIDYHFNNMRP